MNRTSATLAAAILGSSVVFLDATVVNVALQRIGEDLPSRAFGVLEGQSYVYNGYLLSLSALIILAGALADRYGRRRAFLLGLAGFALTSALCGLAPSMEALVLFRILQGASGALLVPGSIALLSATFEGEARGRAFGLWAAASAAVGVAGPVLGGVLVDSVSWRAVFFINLPLAAIAIWLTARFVAESRETDPEALHGRFDWLGAAVGGMSLGGLAFGAIYGQQHDWRDAVGPLALAIGLVAGAVFVVLMAVRRNPLVPPELFGSRNFTVTNLTTFLIYGAMAVAGYLTSIFSQGTLGYSAAAAGFVGVPSGLLLALLSPRIGALSARIGPRRFMAIGPLLMALGVLWLARVPADSRPWLLRVDDLRSYVPSSGFLVDFLPFGLLLGAGLAILVAPLTTALMASVPPGRTALASAVNNAASRIGPQLIGAVAFVAVTGAFYADLASRSGVDTSSPAVRLAVSPLDPPAAGTSAALAGAARLASTDGYHLGMAIAAGLLLLGAVLNGAGIVDPERRRIGRGAAEASDRDESATATA